MKGSAPPGWDGPSTCPLVLSMMKLATWSRNMGLRSFFCRKLCAVSQGSSDTLYGSFRDGPPSLMSMVKT